jgi:hypothetical protein
MDKLIPHIIKNKDGQLLIEAIVAISVMMVGMLAVFGVLSESLSLNRVAADQYIGANLASEGIEIVKNMVDSEYSLGFGFGLSPALVYMDGKKCAIDINTTLSNPPDSSGCTSDPPALKFDKVNGYSLGADNQTKFQRYVEIKSSGNTIEVKSTVEWKRKGGATSKITAIDTLYNWRRSG